MRRIAQFAVVVALSGLLGCGGGSQTLPVANNPPNAPIGIGGSDGTPIQYATEFPNALPQDSVQPWEELGSDGKVISATGASTEFLEGPQTHLESGDTSSWNGALRMASGAVGAGNLSYAMYRIPLGGDEPGVVSVDANLRPMDDGNIGGYWVGLADYGNGSWQWFGPVTEAHWRISTVQAARESSRYTSSFGSVFVCVVAHDGAAIDIVGIGVDPVDLGDTAAPDAPGGLVLTPVASGLEVSWGPVGGSDVAGYKVYYNDSAFTELTAQFANTVQSLQGRTFILDLADEPIQEYWVALRAVDISGNESALGAVLSASPLVGTAPELDLETTGYSAMRGEQVSLTASGASLYDWDTDGDGIFDILDDATGTADVDTSQTGLIRPLVRGTGSDSTSVAMSAVSVIVSSNSRPVAFAKALPAFGDAPLPVVFRGVDSTDFDGTIVGGGWDFDGDGTFDVWDEADIVHVTLATYRYTTGATFNAKLKVVDNEGAWDVDTVTITVGAPPDPDNIPPTADLTADVTSGDAPFTVAFDAGGSSDSDGTIVEYAWDWEGDGIYDGFTDTPTANHTFTEAGSPEVKLRVEDNNGARATAMLTITVNVVGNQSPTAALSATPNSGDTPLDVALDASASNDPDGSIVNYEWDFDGDGTYDSYGSGSSTDHTYTAAGVFTAKVRVTDNSGAQATATALVSVNSPPAAELTATPPDCNKGGTIRYSAEGSTDSDGTIVDYEWDLDADGVFNEAGAESDNQGNSALEQTYPDPGEERVTVRVTDDAGGIDTASVSVTVHGWTGGAVDTTGYVGRYTSLAIVDGLPAISYFDSTNDDLKFVRATDASGSAWGTPATPDITGSVGLFTSLAVVDGLPAISYLDWTNYDLKYVRATDASGSTWGTPLAIDTGPVGSDTSLVIVDGLPAISYHDNLNYDLKYVRATDASGSAWGTPLAVDTADDVGRYTSLAIVDGNPAISYWDYTNLDLKYVRATNASGSTWGTPLAIDTAGDVGYLTSLAIVDGLPAISYFDDSNEDLKYVRATDASGSTWGTPLAIETTGSVGEYTSLAIVDGLPAISYYDYTNGDLKYVRATDASGSAWGTPLAVDTAGNVGGYTFLAIVDGNPAISYLDWINYDLKFVRLY